MNFLFGVIAGVIGGAVGAFFVIRNNPAFVNLDKILVALGKDKLAELKSKAEELLK